MKKLWPLLFVVLAISPFFWKQFRLYKAIAVIKVVDESGRPMSNITVRTSFQVKSSWTSAPEYDSQEKVTPKSGVVRFVGRTEGPVYWRIAPPGYYPYWGQLQLDGMNLLLEHTNVAVLKKIINPIAMLNGGGDRYLPALNVACGYDLVVNDWVAPHGKGKNSDFIFTANGEVVDNLNFRGHLQLRFPNPHDGILQVPFDRFYGSELRLPRVAPANGYQPEWHWRVGYGSLQDQAFQPPVDASTAKVAYVFRVRTAVDDSGQIVRAHYGCLVGELAFDPRTDRGAAFLRFNYYLNPTPNDRNLERDPEKTVSSLVP
jgi:hypothetical protein